MKTFIYAFTIFLFMIFSPEIKSQDKVGELPIVKITSIQQVAPLTALIEWNSINVGNLVGYQLQVSDDESFIYPFTNIITSKTGYEAAVMVSQQIYYCRVRVVAIVEGYELPGPWSSVISFTVQ